MPYENEFNNKLGSVGYVLTEERQQRGRDSVGTRGVVDCDAPSYNPASWKTIPFYVDSSNDEFGRRVDVYEYCLSQDVGSKDLGRKARRFKLEGYLIGTDQPQITMRMVNAAENPEPGPLQHPMFGTMTVSCISLIVSADYRKSKKVTKLAFEFVEGDPTWQRFGTVNTTNTNLFDATQAAATQAALQVGQPGAAQGAMAIGEAQTDDDNALGEAMKQYTANSMEPLSGEGAKAVPPPPPQTPQQQPQNVAQSPVRLPTGTTTQSARDVEKNFDALDMLKNSMGMAGAFQPTPPATRGAVPFDEREALPERPLTTTQSLLLMLNAISLGSATIRNVHDDALQRLRDINTRVVNEAKNKNLSDAGEWMLVTVRLILARDFAVVCAQMEYETITEALSDLDFLMQIYDEEEQIATLRCADVLVNDIRNARAVAASVILANNIRRPGIAKFPVDGVWSSLIVAHKLYQNAQRYESVERYNPEMSVFFMGRDVIAPAA